MLNGNKDLSRISLSDRCHMLITMGRSYKQVYTSRDITQFG